MNPLFDLLPLPIRDRLNYGTITMDDEGIRKLYNVYSLAAPKVGEEKTIETILRFIEAKETEILARETESSVS